MAIRVDCPCGKQYKVADEHAGKNMKCKACNTVLPIPTPKQTVKSTAVTQPAIAIDAWHVDSHDGNHYGPVTRAELDQWVEQGLISAECRLRREGEETSVLAMELYPQLALESDDSADDDAGFGGGDSTADDGPANQSMLRATGKDKSAFNRIVAGELKLVPGATLAGSPFYQVGHKRSIWETLKANTVIGPIQSSEIQLDSLQVFRMRDALGEFAAIIPFDRGMVAPIEFVARMPGAIPHSMVLLKQSGGKVAMEVGAVMGGPIGALLGQLGTKVESVWAGCDATLPPLARALQGASALRDGIRWEGKIGGGPVSAIYHITWGVQVLPLDDESYLLVAKSVPKQKFMGFELGVAWFANYRRTFAQFLAAQPAAATGEMNCYDPGIWFACCIESLKWLAW